MRMNVAQKSGTTVMAKTYEAKMESTTPSARGVKIYLLTPERKVTGKKTMEVVEVAASTARETSMPPCSAASLGGTPISIKRKIFSSTTTESSIKREKANARPPNSMVLIEPPMALVKSRHTRAESGIDSSTAKVARGLPRKTRIINPVRTRPIEASLTRFLIASLTKIDRSKTTAVFRLSGMSTSRLI